MPGVMRTGMVRRIHGGVVTEEPPPFDATGLWSWLKADAITGLSDGDPVTTWEDAHTSNHDATQSTSASKPTYKTSILNSLPVLRCDGTDDYLVLPDASALTAGTGFVVVKLVADPPASDPKTGLWDFGTEDTRDHYPYTDGTVYDGFGSSARKTTANPAASLASWRIYTVLTKSGEWTSWVDETQLFTTATNTVAFNSTPYLGRGQSSGSNAWLDGDMAEFLLFDSDIGSTRRTEIWDYLQAKYAL
jgi:hypothetical protein